MPFRHVNESGAWKHAPQQRHRQHRRCPSWIIDVLLWSCRFSIDQSMPLRRENRMVPAMLQPSRDTAHRLVYSVAELLATRHPSSTHLFFSHDEGHANVREARVIGSYVAVLPPEAAASEPNRWIFVLRTGEQSTTTIELKQSDPLGSTAVCCYNGPRVLETGELEGCAKSWTLAIRDGNVVGDWMDRLVDTGLTKYKLVQELGKSRAVHSTLKLTRSQDRDGGWIAPFSSSIASLPGRITTWTI